jgi:hypothetical protein
MSRIDDASWLEIRRLVQDEISTAFRAHLRVRHPGEPEPLGQRWIRQATEIEERTQAARIQKLERVERAARVFLDVHDNAQSKVRYRQAIGELVAALNVADR